MPPRYKVVPLKPTTDDDAPATPSLHRQARSSSIAPAASLLSQQPRKMSVADRKAMNLAELLASSSPLPPPPQLRDVDTLVKTPGKKEKKKSRSKRRAEREVPAGKKITSPPPPAAARQPRRTSREVEDMFAALELLPTSSPLPPRPKIRTEDELAAKVEKLRAEPAAAAGSARKHTSRDSHRPLRPALVEKPSHQGKKKVLRVQTKAQRLDLGARAKAAVAELEHPPADPSTPLFRPRASRKDLTPLRSPTISSLFDICVD